MSEFSYWTPELIHQGVIVAVIAGLCFMLLRIRKDLNNWMDIFRR